MGHSLGSLKQDALLLTSSLSTTLSSLLSILASPSALRIQLLQLIVLILEHLVELLCSRATILVVLVDQNWAQNKRIDASDIV